MYQECRKGPGSCGLGRVSLVITPPGLAESRLRCEAEGDPRGRELPKGWMAACATGVSFLQA